MNDICIGNFEQRFFIVAGANTMKYIVSDPQSPITNLETTTWFPNIYFQQVDQPDVPDGIKACVSNPIQYCIRSLLMGTGDFGRFLRRRHLGHSCLY